jgi:hypothetical protein
VAVIVQKNEDIIFNVAVPQHKLYSATKTTNKTIITIMIPM